MDPAEWQVRSVLGDCTSKAKVISIHAPQFPGIFALISDLLDLAKLQKKNRGSSIGHDLDQGPT